MLAAVITLIRSCIPRHVPRHPTSIERTSRMRCKIVTNLCKIPKPPQHQLNLYITLTFLHLWLDTTVAGVWSLRTPNRAASHPSARFLEFSYLGFFYNKTMSFHPRMQHATIQILPSYCSFCPSLNQCDYSVLQSSSKKYRSLAYAI